VKTERVIDGENENMDCAGEISARNARIMGLWDGDRTWPTPMLNCFNTIADCDGQTDERQTDVF